MLTLDIQGAFDAVFPGRLRLRLAQQGWPKHLVDWVFSFCTDRTVDLVVDGIPSPPLHPARGIPQGSPVSPVLFLLFTAPLHRLPLRTTSFGYADDVSLLARGPQLTDTTQALENDLAQILDWANQNALDLELSKSELLHFSRRRNRFNPAVTLPGLRIEPAEPASCVRWLGVHFDRTLSFRAHVRIARSKAMGAVGAIRGLGNTVRGACAFTLRAAAVACVIPTFLYGHETWWPTPVQDSGSNSRSFENDFQAVLSAAARAILPVWRTTPISALSREAGLPPARAWLDLATDRASLRLRRLDASHPLLLRVRSTDRLARDLLRANKPTDPDTCTRLLRLWNRTKGVELVPPDLRPPWNPPPDYSPTLQSVGFSIAERPTKAALFSEWLDSLPADHLVIYTDGSRLSDGRTGCACAGFQEGVEVFRHSLSLGHSCEIPDAEATGVQLALAAAADFGRPRSAVHVCPDNLDVAARASCPDIHSRSAIEAYRDIRTYTSLSRVPVNYRWCPGHSGIQGNETADSVSKSAAATPPLWTFPTTHAAFRRIAKTRFWKSAQTRWDENRPGIYPDLPLRADCVPTELKLPRNALGWLIAARTGHGDFASYHERFGGDDAVLRCRCGELKTQVHFFYCRSSPERPFAGPDYEGIPFLLGTARGATRFADWALRTRFFDSR